MRTLITRLLALLSSFFKQEPAVILGSFASLLSLASMEATNAEVTTWAALVPVLVSALIRHFVTSPATTETHGAMVKILAEALHDELVGRLGVNSVRSPEAIEQIVAVVANSMSTGSPDDAPLTPERLEEIADDGFVG